MAKKYTRPRMRNGKCVDILTDANLPEKDCLTTSGKEPSRRRTHTVEKDGKQYECRKVHKTSYVRDAQDISRQGYDRESYTRPQYTRCPSRKPYCKPSEKFTVPEKSIPSTTVQSTTFSVPRKEIERKGYNLCSLKGDTHD